MTTAALEQRLAASFGGKIAICLHADAATHAYLFPEEEALIAGAAEKRRLEFTTGRICAREALAKLGAPSCPILMAADRSPIWPAGFVGSISHTDSICGAVVARTSERNGLGLDIETSDSLPEELIPLVCSMVDRQHFSTLPKCTQPGWEKIAFCAKEAFHKCQYPLTRHTYEFNQLSIRFSGEPSHGMFRTETEPGVAKIEGLSGFWFVDQDKIFAGAFC